MRPSANTAAALAPLWYLHADAGTRKAGMWVLDPPDDEWWYELCHRRAKQPMRRGDWPTPAPLFSWKHDAGFPDAAWSGTRPRIVSSALRRLIERESLEVASFHPVRLKGPPGTSPPAPYWFVDWKRRWNCQPDPGVAEIDAARVPAGERIGVVANDGWWSGGQVLVRNELRLEMLRAGIRGLRFTPVLLALPATSLVKGLNPRTGRRELVQRALVPSERCFCVQAFLAAGGKPNGRGSVPNSSPFLDYVAAHSAMGTLSMAIVRRFLEAGADPNVGTGPNVSALLVVIHPKSPALIRLLARHGANFNVKNAMNGHTPLMSAVAQSSVPTVRSLLASGAEINATDAAGSTALDEAYERIESEELNPSRVRTLLAPLLKAGALRGSQLRARRSLNSHRAASKR